MVVESRRRGKIESFARGERGSARKGVASRREEKGEKRERGNASPAEESRFRRRFPSGRLRPGAFHITDDDSHWDRLWTDRLTFTSAGERTGETFPSGSRALARVAVEKWRARGSLEVDVVQ